MLISAKIKPVALAILKLCLVKGFFKYVNQSVVIQLFDGRVLE